MKRIVRTTCLTIPIGFDEKLQCLSTLARAASQSRGIFPVAAKRLTGCGSVPVISQADELEDTSPEPMFKEPRPACIAAKGESLAYLRNLESLC
jgi:hypothetical protein